MGDRDNGILQWSQKLRFENGNIACFADTLSLAPQLTGSHFCPNAISKCHYVCLGLVSVLLRVSGWKRMFT